MRRILRGARSRSGAAFVSLLAVAALVAACNVVSNSQDPPTQTDVFDKVRGVDLLPRFPQQADTANSQAAGRGAQPAAYYGAGAGAPPTFTGAQPTPGGDAFELNFENAPVTTVAK